MGFIDGTCVKQESSAVLSQQWERCNAIVLGWIRGSLSQELYVGQVYSEVASEVWAKLKETYNKMDGEFDILTILTACVCEGRTACTCDAKSGSVKYTQLIRLMQFLIGLNDVYQLIRSTILAKDPLPNVKDAFYVVSREESHKGLHLGSSGTNKSQPAAFVAKTINNTNNFNRKVNTNNNNKSVSRGPNPNLTCTNCGLIGHTMERCYEIIRYPAGFKRYLNFSKQYGNNSKRFNANCEVNQSIPSTSGSLSSSFTHEQMMKLVSLINENPSPAANIELWHCKLGHPADQVLSILGTKLCFSKNNQRSPCDICHKAKQTREPFPLTDHKSKSVGDMFHCDVWGPYRVVSKDGFRFFLTIVDDFSRAVWVYLLKSKVEVGEYVKRGIPLNMWPECVLTAVYLINRLPSSVLSGVSPYFLVYGNDPGLSHVRSESPYDEEGDTSNDDGNIGVSSDDYDNIVEDEVADVATQIEENVISEGNGQINQNGEGPSNVLGTSPNLRRSTRQKVMPIKFNDYVVSSYVKYGLEKYVSYANLSRRNFYFSTTLNKSIEPKTFHEAS
ncbi:ribonuclease H-like domain-containing protein [Tanacetum coccineum]